MPGKKALPAGWPPDVTYTHALDISSNDVNPDLRRRMQKLISEYKMKCKTKASKNVKIKVIHDLEHPANNQRGLFAARRFEPREWVINYAGELLPDFAKQLEASDYCLRFVEGHSIDGSRMGNEARFANDFRGVRGVNRPNIEFSEFEPTKTSGSIAILGFRVMHKPIKKGEELLASYGKGFWQGRGLIRGDVDSCISTCPGRHGLDEFVVPEGSTYLCFPCSMPVDHAAMGFHFCECCNYGVCEACFRRGAG
mmetsp:Transcript_51165/g.153716  ORF Transcript_51165/g.153716 Transcript_51165/m.153716 type:complete len:253 (-) Transcript_51165:318-1076(-)|eukprot:CAMPEP_0113536446 /NCGR_PEP_ID=MMETSP0015_2-20120614/6263_1 /TAXON_ID=2838 /ORGANISM="Odontella" /LENGTH=252 /DNA_ID=CAMNT_0000435807 /DNA_START=180 /DNA_END=938 /DNA_ORIENTATION=- /assembly_acc=CAM_ASM_000160